MSFSTSDLPSTLLLIALGVIIGAALSKILNRGPSVTELQQKLEESQDQLDQYRKDVDRHFQTTAELVNNLTQSYRAVHEHLSQGAQKLTSHTSSNTLESTQFKALSDTHQTATDTPTTEESSQVATQENPSTTDSDDNRIESSEKNS